MTKFSSNIIYFPKLDENRGSGNFKKTKKKPTLTPANPFKNVIGINLGTLKTREFTESDSRILLHILTNSNDEEAANLLHHLGLITRGNSDV